MMSTGVIARTSEDRVELKGKTAVITGGASGIGLATAKAFAAAGANLVLGDIEPEPLEAAVEDLKSVTKVIGVATDVAKEDDVFALRDAAVAEFGTAHVVFNNAGVGAGGAIGTPKAIWDWVMRVNVDGVINGINAFIPLFLEQNEGHVVSTASLAGLGGVPGMGAYCASKFAVVGISESLFHELALRGSKVGVSVLCPGFVRTRIAESFRNMPDELKSYGESREARDGGAIVSEIVNQGIDPALVGDAVTKAVLANDFWIFTHEKAALRTTEQRLDWMRGGTPSMINLEGATKP
jgi:NAD(P)-dependent dehydrogenase (short-subunit alcohol dehydrogenase family)